MSEFQASPSSQTFRWTSFSKDRSTAQTGARGSAAARHTFSKVPSIVALFSLCTRALTCQKFRGTSWKNSRFRQTFRGWRTLARGTSCALSRSTSSSSPSTCACRCLYVYMYMAWRTCIRCTRMPSILPAPAGVYMYTCVLYICMPNMYVHYHWVPAPAGVDMYTCIWHTCMWYACMPSTHVNVCALSIHVNFCIKYICKLLH
jgi:hypothetical protein